MSEHDTDKHYAAWWEPPLVFLLIAIVAGGYDACHGSHIRDLQRRVGELEQRGQR